MDYFMLNPEEMLVITRALDNIEEFGCPEDHNPIEWFKILVDKYEVERHIELENEIWDDLNKMQTI